MVGNLDDLHPNTKARLHALVVLSILVLVLLGRMPESQAGWPVGSYSQPMGALGLLMPWIALLRRRATTWN